MAADPIEARMVMYGMATNLVANPGFETAGAGDPDFFGSWTETAGNGTIARTITAGEFYLGIAAAKLTAGASANTKVAITLTGLTAATVYPLSFWTRGDGTYGGRYGVYDVTNSADITAATATAVTSTTYTQKVTSFTTPALCTSVRLDLWCPSTNTGIAYFDDVLLIENGYPNNDNAVTMLTPTPNIILDPSPNGNVVER
jgi:hypothetical protein